MRIIKEDTSKTIDQEFSDNVNFSFPEGTRLSLRCNPSLNFDSHRPEKVAIMTVEWHRAHPGNDFCNKIRQTAPEDFCGHIQ